MRIKNVADLIGRLEECERNAPVAIASQPEWPFEYAITEVGQGDDGTVYIAAGRQVGYLSSAGREAIGW